MQRKILILSGPSGSGKSTWAKEYQAKYGAVICSADDHFVSPETGEYKFDPTQIAVAHSNCLNKFMNALRMSEIDIIVDNTNITRWEWQNYYDAAAMVSSARGEHYEIEIHSWHAETVREIWICAKRNSHGVPVDIVAKMALNHDITPGFVHRIEE